MMRKALALVLALGVSCGLWGCGGCNSGSGQARPAAEASSAAVQPQAATPAAPEPPPAPRQVVVEQVAMPAFTPGQGSYTASQLVAIDCSTPNAEIHYTVDGSTPTASSRRYTGRIDVTSTRTVKAHAIRSGMGDSEVAAATYVIEAPGTVNAPSISPSGGTFYTPQTVRLTTSTSGAMIHYTADGSEPTEASPVYSAPMAVSGPTTVKAFASKQGMKPSTVAVAVFKITGSVGPVTVTPAGGAYSSSQKVALSTPTSGATVRYTLDGTAPTASSPVYSAPIEISANATLFAQAVMEDWESSPIASARYTFQVATPAISPASGDVAGPVSAVVATETPGATIRYTLDGSAPGPSSALYTGPVEITSPASLRAVAMRDGWNDSGLAQGSWRLPVAAPKISPDQGLFSEPQTVTMTSATPGAMIRYTTDGTDPNPSSERYAGPVKVAANRTIKAVATREEWKDSPVAYAAYAFRAEPPLLDPQGGSHAGARQVTMTCPTPGAMIRYTTDGSAPNVSSPLYSGPVNVAASQTVKAAAFVEGWEPSQPVEGAYRISVEQPEFSPAGGVFSEPQTVAITCATPAAKVYYSTDSSLPGEKSTLYTVPVAIRRPTTLKAVALVKGMENSPVVSLDYVIDRLPDTGQSKCYDSGNSTIPCGATGQDGEYSILPMAFKDNGDQTVTDNVTGMVWQKQDDNKTREWAEADRYCADLKLGGFTDWRLPTRRELMSIVDFSKASPAIDSAAFPGTANRYYWSSTLSPFISNGVWALSFDNGYLVDVTKTGFNYYARCVR